MGIPPNEREWKLALYDWCGIKIRDMIKERFDPETTTILDVGAGWGKYHHLMPEYKNIDACEIWQPYIEQCYLEEFYRLVHPVDIESLIFQWYDVIIFGDVFEHFERDKARRIIDHCFDKCEEMYIAVPFEMEQEMVANNPYEEHKQNDLNREIMEKYFPELKYVGSSYDDNQNCDGHEKVLYVKNVS